MMKFVVVIVFLFKKWRGVYKSHAINNQPTNNKNLTSRNGKIFLFVDKNCCFFFFKKDDDYDNNVAGFIM